MICKTVEKVLGTKMKSDIVNSEKAIYKKDIGKNAIQNMRLYMKYMVFQGIVYDCCIRKQ